MRVKLAYGKEGLHVNLPNSTAVIEPVHIPGLANEKEKAFEAMRNPIGTGPLKEMVKTTDKVSIVISDLTRPTPNHKLVPWILEELNHVPKEQFVIINGTGSHRDNTREELIQMLGEEVVNSVRIINNNAFDKSTQSYLGTTSYGAEVYLNKEYCESDIKIVTGFIEPHFFAGFSGGPKGIMPGIAGIDTIMHFHNARMIGDQNSTWGKIEGNPVQGEATEAALMAKPDFMLNVTLNGDKEITNYFAGDVIKAHRAGCEYVREHSMAACEEPFDIVITSNSGYPLDQNLYQAVKGMSAAQKIVRKGGAIICAAECSDGLPNHGNYAEILKMKPTPQEILEMIDNPEFSIFDQWQVQKQALIQVWADVYVYSTLSNEDIENAMFLPTDSIEKTVEELIEKNGENTRIAVLPLGPLTIPYIKDAVKS
ncbi:nickel-dependent lactate racemase [Bacillus sp. ISL-47]|uniref:nickel-dependent lactate racemase n=1 Tax=Bacillus sp. ISL-47 TaxID=2819130 RepID=UPI001BE6B6EB|nr:nickel-dependent lactate racemase [Bacillus sp. ISL-47]MBT2688690.1 nickel-dependent lactate racemase [Bacillus sp. ISL-47]MBT2707410.1 nickel-dependent lactate racemase [Pseudomonas sp. ISL-84]